MKDIPLGTWVQTIIVPRDIFAKICRLCDEQDLRRWTAVSRAVFGTLTQQVLRKNRYFYVYEAHGNGGIMSLAGCMCLGKSPIGGVCCPMHQIRYFDSLRSARAYVETIERGEITLGYFVTPPKRSSNDSTLGPWHCKTFPYYIPITKKRLKKKKSKKKKSKK